MAFDTAQQRIDAVGRVGNILGTLRTVHHFALLLRDARALYQAGTDPAFNAAFDAIFNAAGDRSELSTMIVQLTALVITDWEASHGGVLGTG